MDRSDARAYLRSLAALHLAFVLFAVGGLLSVGGLSVIGGPVLVAGVAMWVVAIAAGHLRAARHARGKPLFGGDGMQAEANWWLGWGPLAEAAEATGRDAGDLRRLAVASLMVGATSVVLWFPVAAIAS